MRKVKVLFVCLGNICRSPLAEAIFNYQIKQQGLEHSVEADSCGTSNYNIGSSPDFRTMANATKNGISMNHCGRQFSEEDFEKFDFIMAMDSSNMQKILRFPASKNFIGKVKLIRDFDPIQKGEVPDPYPGEEKDFQEVYDILQRTMSNFVGHIARNFFGKKISK